MKSRALISLYEELLFVRCLDEKISSLSKQGRARLYTPFRGQEAAQVALGQSLSEEDWLLPTFRDTGLIYTRGVDLESIFCFWMGYEEAHLGFGKTWPVCAPVATQLPHAVGVALGEKYQNSGHAVAVCLGDGAMSKGDCHEAMNLAAVWSLPVLFYCQNNRWAISTPIEKQSSVQNLVDRAQSYQIRSIQVDANDIKSTKKACHEALAYIKDGYGPVFIEALTWREGGHSVIDQPRLYRDDLAKPPVSAIDKLEVELLQKGIEVVELRQTLSKQYEEELNQAVKRAEYLCQQYKKQSQASFEYTYAQSPPELKVQAQLASTEGIECVSKAHITQSISPTILFKNTQNRSQEGEKLNLSEAINLALHEAMAEDQHVITLGQDVAQLGGVFKATQGLLARFGEDRVIDTPISESGMIGATIGLAALGEKPVCEVQFAGFIYSAYEQLRSHAGRLRQRTRGNLSAPLVIRTPVGGGVGAPESHCESIEALFAQTPGIKVVTPSGPRTARALLRAAIADPDPVLFLEPTSLYFSHKEWVPSHQESIPIGYTLLRHKGSDLTIVSYGAGIHRLMSLNEELKPICSLDILELATISPIDMAPIIRSLKKTQRLLVFHEGTRTGDMGAEILTRVTESGIKLKSFERLTGWDIPYPYPSHEDIYYSSDDDLRSCLLTLCEQAHEQQAVNI